MLPAYMKIHDQIKKDIDEHRWPSVRDFQVNEILAEQFAVSRMTLRQAISLLVEEGVFRAPCRKRHLCIQYTCTRKMRGTTSFTEIVKSKVKYPLANSFPTENHSQ